MKYTKTARALTRGAGYWSLSHRIRQLSAAHLVLLGFLALIGVGTFLLSLPVSARDGLIPPSTALFTATSAVCVTGLTVVDTGSRFSPFGQAVILLLIQLGGLGYMTGATLVALLAGRNISLRGRVLLGESFELSSLQDRVRLVRSAVFTTLAIEAIGALLLAARFAALPGFAAPEALSFGLFHSVSAFCNAGFDLMGYRHPPGTSLVPYVDDVWVNGIIAALVVCGGLGFATLWEVGSRSRRRRLSLHTRICLVGTALLLGIGFLGVLGLEWNNRATLGGLPAPSQVLAAFFQSVSARTAGFQTLAVGEMRSITLLLLCLLMFVGACPGGTAGGIKVTTLAIILGSVWSTLRGREEPELFGRRIIAQQLLRALSIVTLAIGVALLALGILVFTEPDGLRRAQVTPNVFMALVFEVTSALGTVGMSTGITPHLSGVGQAVIIVLMFVGRVGPLTAAAALTARQPVRRPRFAEERVLLG